MKKTVIVATSLVVGLVVLIIDSTSGRHALRTDANSANTPTTQNDAEARSPDTAPSAPGRASTRLPDKAGGRVKGSIVVPAALESKPRVTISGGGKSLVQERREGGEFDIRYDRDSACAPYSLEVRAKRMRPVSTHLPTADENVGEIVLRPGLSYRGRLLTDYRPCVGVRVTLRDEFGNTIGRSTEGTDAEGRFEILISRFDFSTTLATDGSYLGLAVTFGHPTDSFRPVAARPEGLGSGHTIRSERSKQIQLRLRDATDGVSIRMKRSQSSRGRQGSCAARSTTFDSGTTDSQGMFRPSWPAAFATAWAVVGTENPCWFPLERARVAEAGSAVLHVARKHFARIRVLRATNAVAGAEVIAAVRWSQKRPGGTWWLRGTTDERGEVTWTLGATDERGPDPVEFVRVDVLYSVDGVPVRETKSFQDRGDRGWSSKHRLDVDVGRCPIDPTSVWFTCRDADGGLLAPTAVGVLAQVADRKIGVGTVRPRRISLSGIRRADLFEARGVALPASGILAPAKSATFMVETAERGVRRFAISREVWQRASSARHPIEFVFPQHRRLDRRIRVVDPDGAPVERAIVSVIPADSDAWQRRLEYVYASTDEDGTVQLGHLEPNRVYRIFAHMPNDLRSGYREGFDPAVAAAETTVLLGHTVRFRAELALDESRYSDPQWLTVKLVSIPEGILPSVVCKIAGKSTIVASRDLGLPGYFLQIGTLRDRVVVPAREALSNIVAFPAE